jgi:hypothetical protein
MRFFFAPLLALLLVVVACSSSSAPPNVLVCEALVDNCLCASEPAGNQPGSVKACNPTAFPGTTCCSDPTWPGSGSCWCDSGAIYCGVVKGYVMTSDAGAGEDACVCSSMPETGSMQAPGATCYPDGTTTSGSSFGTCCFFPPDAPGALGVAACICAAGIHPCGAGGMSVQSCSATNFPAASPTCPSGSKVVAGCS